ELGKEMGFDESGERHPFADHLRKTRGARERDDQRRPVHRQQDAEDRSEVAQVRQRGQLRFLSYNSLHSGAGMQALCRASATSGCAAPHAAAGSPLPSRRPPVSPRKAPAEKRGKGRIGRRTARLRSKRMPADKPPPPSTRSPEPPI